MNKGKIDLDRVVYELLLSKGFKNPKDVLEVVETTPNPKVALELLLGIYTPVICATQGVMNNIILVFDSFNRRTNMVSFHSELCKVEGEDVPRRLNGFMPLEQWDLLPMVTDVLLSNKRKGIMATYNPKDYEDKGNIIIS